MENSIPRLFLDIPKDRVFGKEIGFIIGCGRSIFTNSAIVDENVSFREEDIRRVITFWKAISPSKEECERTGSNWYDVKGPLQHFVITSYICRHLAEKIGKNNPDNIVQALPTQMEIVGLLHDLGRNKTHQFYVTDVLTEYLMTEIGISSKIRKSLHKIEWFWNIDEPLRLETISLNQMISALADTLGKIGSSQSRLRRPNELIQDVKNSKQKHLDCLVKEHVEEYNRREELVLNYALKFIEDLGVNIEEILESLDWMVQFSGEDLIK